MNISVAIDGPAGSGKSTITKQVAKELGFNYIDTGALYRSLCYTFLEKNLKELNEEKIAEILKDTEIKVYFKDFKQYQEVNGVDITDKIRTNEVSTYTSLFARSKNVRDYLIDIQRDLANFCDVIMDGRDIASVVLPKADVKIYLTASVEERAGRRFKELRENGESVDIEELKKNIETRDNQDKNREIAPLVKVDDAIEIDTSNMTIEQVVNKIKEIIEKVRVSKLSV
ncbi:MULTISPECIES: (d)CMP kinase [unclassified Gemella]|uniref:(d)CMP kinase n=1 Tax=unclassified Gemella TaxID=2624949 RepID=UPI0010734FC0|nr:MULTISPECIES: (d)CMP kinase [unclassified Gemella]MBF0709798.1 (d)CMP kinase [Gemella sp. GL1.1]MBF0747114.1 (d)CMP kinase [Gemella sp. 19428wG2_WT2a]NYS27142.1 (d)CMP kinase [Gemella sp. GL1]TFU58357.1 (d)CMP kinase [Gemella sp. WT2a]